MLLTTCAAYINQIQTEEFEKDSPKHSTSPVEQSSYPPKNSAVSSPRKAGKIPPKAFNKMTVQEAYHFMGYSEDTLQRDLVKTAQTKDKKT